MSARWVVEIFPASAGSADRLVGNLRARAVRILEDGGAADDGQPARTRAALLGQLDTRPAAELRGNEDLGEARFGVTLGDTRWLRVDLVRGWTPFSPDFGVRVRAGFRGGGP